MESRLKKRLIIIIIYIAISLLFLWGLYEIFKPAETCMDGIKNQNEEEADCGGVCARCRKIKVQDLKIGENGIVDSSLQGKYDFYGLVINPNNIYGSNYFEYRITLKDDKGGVISERNGNSYILPGEEKYIIENNMEAASFPAIAEFEIANPKWMEFEYYEKPQLKVINKTINEVGSGVGFAEAVGLLRNESPFDFNVIKIKVILKDADSKIIALNSTEMRTVRSSEEREFKVLWPNKFPGVATYVEVQPEVNVYSSEAFTKKYFKQQQF